MSTSVTSRLEEMRKTGGDKWLSLLNTGTRAPGSPVIDGVSHWAVPSITYTCTRYTVNTNMDTNMEVCNYTKDEH